MRRRLGYYVHHQGAGHAARAAAITSCMTVPVSLLSELALTSTRPDVDVVLLGPDRDARSHRSDPTAHGALHWAPLQPDLLGPRTDQLVGWLTQPDVAGLISDVSVETALLARLCGVRTVAVRMHGRRDDLPHLLGAGVVDAFLAPYPLALEDPGTPADVRARTFHSGFPRVAAARPTRREARQQLGLDSDQVITVVVGAGGHQLTPPLLRGLDAELAGTGTEAVVVGQVDDAPALRQVRLDGWVPDIGAHLAAADVVFGASGRGVVAEVARGRHPFVAVPQERPFGEQEALAERMGAVGVAIVLSSWPGVATGGPSWLEAADRARALDPSSWDQLDGPDGASRAARWLEDTFELRPRSVA